MIRIAIDTSVLVGLLDRKDVWHGQSVALKEVLKREGTEIAIFDCVLAEAISVMVRRIREQRRNANLNDLLRRLEDSCPTSDILWILPDVPVLYEQVIDLIRISSGRLNFNDALIALACRYRKISMIASFDTDFEHVEWLRRVSRPEDLN